MTEEAKDRQENAIDKILTLIDAEAWAYCDYLTQKYKGGSREAEGASHLSSNIRERLMEELPDILSDEYEKAFMDGFESHPKHNAYQKAFEDIREELLYTMDMCEPGNPKQDNFVGGLQIAAEILNKHDPSKAGRENE